MVSTYMYVGIYFLKCHVGDVPIIIVLMFFYTMLSIYNPLFPWLQGIIILSTEIGLSDLYITKNIPLSIESFKSLYLDYNIDRIIIDKIMLSSGIYGKAQQNSQSTEWLKKWIILCTAGSVYIL